MERMHVLGFARQVDFMRQLPLELCTRVCDNLEFREVSAGEVRCSARAHCTPCVAPAIAQVVVRENEIGIEFFIITAGSVGVYTATGSADNAARDAVSKAIAIATAETPVL